MTCFIFQVLFTFFIFKLLLSLLITILAHHPTWARHQHHQPDTHLFQKQCLEMMKLHGKELNIDPSYIKLTIRWNSSQPSKIATVFSSKKHSERW